MKQYTRSGRGRFRIARAKAPAKVILVGEHFVVLGAAALSMAVNMYSEATATITPTMRGGIEVSASVPLEFLDNVSPDVIEAETARILRPLRTAAKSVLDLKGRANKDQLRVSVQTECKIPIGAGLGSSASTSVAIIAAVASALNVKLSRERIFQLAFEPERVVHTRPSGIDQATATHGGLIEYTFPGKIRRVAIPREPTLLVCDSGIHRSTGKLVGAVVRRSEKHREAYGERLQEVSEIESQARRSLENSDFETLGSLMDRNQELLSQIGVSHPALERLIAAARSAGALGAKLTGAGGGGCMIALCEDERQRRMIARALRRKGGVPYVTRLSKTGVVLENR